MDLRRLAVFAAALAALVAGAEASIHTYDREPFCEVGNAFLLSGGSEGIVADEADPAAPPSSFIKLLRNRVSAQQAREEEAYLTDLEVKVKDLEKNSEMEERLSTLQNENQMLRRTDTEEHHRKQKRFRKHC